MHRNNKFGEKFVTRAKGEDILNSRNRISCVFDCLFRSAKIRYPTTNCVIFLGDDEGSTYPGRATSGQKNTNFDKSIKFCFELGQLGTRNWIGLTLMGYNGLIDLEVYEFIGVVSKYSIRHSGTALKNIAELFSLIGGLAHTVVGNCTNVGRTIIRCQDVQC